MEKETKIFLGIIVIIAIGTTYLKINEQHTPTGMSVVSRSQASGDVKEFDVEIYQFGYEPDTITVNQGDLVRLKISTRDVAHGFAIQEYNINEYIKPGQPANLEFVANQKGTFKYYCNIPCGRGHMMMRGEFIVK